MLGTVSIVDLRVRCVIGCLPRERREEQDLVVEIALDRDLQAAVASDAIGQAMDYVEVAQELTRCLQGGAFQLIETAAERCCERLFQRWPELQRCRLTIKKPGAIAAARFAAVTVERHSPVP